MAVQYEGTEVVNGVRRKVITAPHKEVMDSKDYQKKSKSQQRREAISRKEETKQETDTLVEEGQDNAKDN